MLKNTQETFFKLFCAKNRSQKKPNIRKIATKYSTKSEFFHHGQKWPQCKGYSLCKIVTGSKFKILKKVLKNTLETFLSCSVQKTALKNT